MLNSSITLAASVHMRHEAQPTLFVVAGSTPGWAEAAQLRGKKPMTTPRISTEGKGLGSRLLKEFAELLEILFRPTQLRPNSLSEGNPLSRALSTFLLASLDTPVRKLTLRCSQRSPSLGRLGRSRALQKTAR